MAYHKSFYRDDLAVDDRLINYIKSLISAGAIPVGGSVLFAARAVWIPAGDFTLEDCDLTIVADHFDGSAGTMRLGTVRTVSDGATGIAGCSLTLLCQWITGLNVELVGGAGGRGVKGAQGPRGETRRTRGGDGGKGSRGGNGGAGGAGGTLILEFIEDGVPGGIGGPTHIRLPGGPGGPPGMGGDGGPGGIGEDWCKPSGTFCVDGVPGDPGPPGDPGQAGPLGSIGSLHINQLDSNAYWLRARNLAPDWEPYRAGMAEYRYRLATSASDTDPGILVMTALTELDAVTELNPGNNEAKALRQQLLQGQNISGDPRDLDVIPDFDHFEEVYTRYTPQVDGMFEAAVNMLDLSIDLGLKRDDLNREITNLTGLSNTLANDLESAKLDRAGAVADTDRSEQRLLSLSREMSDKQEEMRNVQVDVAGVIIGTVALVASVIAAIPTAGTSAVGVAASIALIAGSIKELPVIVGELSKPANQRPELTKLEAEARGLKDYVTKAIDAIRTIISFTKMLDELYRAKIDEAGYKKLLEDGLNAAQQKLQAQMRVAQSDLRVASATDRIHTAQKVLEMAEAQEHSLQGDPEFLSAVSLGLIRGAQHFMDELTRYSFFALRAVEIYTLADLSHLLRYDNGHLNPDILSDHADGFVSSSQLIALYEETWRRYLSLLEYRLLYDNYNRSGNWVSDWQRVSITSPLELAAMKADHELQFSIHLTHMPSRAEDKLDAVLIAFVGAESDSGVISTVIEHGGCYEQRRRSGETLVTNLGPRRAVALARTTQLQDAGGAVGESPEKISLWGRGIAASWYISIEASEFAAQNVDLSNLSEIQVWVRYRALISPAVSAPGRQPLLDGVVLRDASSGRVFVHAGGAKFEIAAPTTSLSNFDRDAAELTVPETVPSWVIDSLPSLPADGTVLRDETSHTVWVARNGGRALLAEDTAGQVRGLGSSGVTVSSEGIGLLPYVGDQSQAPDEVTARG